MDDISLLNLYKEYKEKDDRESGELFAHHFYRSLSRWIEEGKPEQNFVDTFWDFFSDIEESILNGSDLIDLGVLQTTEALSIFRSHESKFQESQLFLNEARLPFFAFLDESTYRLIKNIEFDEIDFQIFEIIGGSFPHDSAQNFLIQNEWADMWLTLRYLDSLDSIPQRLEILERVLPIRDSLPEKLLFIAYILMIDSDIILNSFENQNPDKFSFPVEIEKNLLQKIHSVVQPFLDTGKLDTAWENRVDPFYEKETVFILLALFEISQCPLSPAWVRVLEKGISVFWNLPAPSNAGKFIPQPIQEFTGSIFTLFPDEEAGYLLDTSLILPLFMENLHRYSEESFYDLLTPISRYEELLFREIEIYLSRNRFDINKNKRYSRRIKICAGRIGYSLKIINGKPFLSRKESS